MPSAWSGHSFADEHMLVCGEASEPIGRPVGVALTFRMTAFPSQYVWANLKDALGLTPSEVTVVKRLMSGERAEIISVNSAVSIETVRTHIRRVYTKLNVKSREQLFARVMPFRSG